MLSCEEDDESMEDEDFKPVPNPINSKYGIEKEAPSSTRDNLLQKNMTNNDLPKLKARLEFIYKHTNDVIRSKYIYEATEELNDRADNNSEDMTEDKLNVDTANNDSEGIKKKQSPTLYILGKHWPF